MLEISARTKQAPQLHLRANRRPHVGEDHDGVAHRELEREPADAVDVHARDLEGTVSMGVDPAAELVTRSVGIETSFVVVDGTMSVARRDDHRIEGGDAPWALDVQREVADDTMRRALRG
ncbi:MAG: hypothetical protein H6738_07515 [Alphaproteobacteria bacterium]|nr:hypothetical protein [Alphaproteobacteria bacterium]MCB9696612.1 hypothetical protein [Alphaproteobacteria bacterium]